MVAYDKWYQMVDTSIVADGREYLENKIVVKRLY